MTPHAYQAIIPSPLPGHWDLGLRGGPEGLSCIDLLPARQGGRHCDDGEPMAQAVQAIWDYFEDPVAVTVPPLALAGTTFQRRVWQALLTIPCGQTIGYGELARRLDSSARAVAGACRANPVPLLVPCHRVVAASGLGGYMGQRDGEGVAIKRWLLQHESRR